MPRISVRGTDDTVTLKVSGALIGPWVDELERCWDILQTTREERALRVDVSQLISASPDARQLLGAIERGGAIFISGASPANAFVDELTRRAPGRIVVEPDVKEWPRRTGQQEKSPNGRARLAKRKIHQPVLQS